MTLTAYLAAVFRSLGPRAVQQPVLSTGTVRLSYSYKFVIVSGCEVIREVVIQWRIESQLSAYYSSI